VARAAIAFAAMAALAMALVEAGVPRLSPPLWPGARFTQADRDRAVERGLHFLYFSVARNPDHFREYGSDLLFAFYKIWETSRSETLARMAWTMGHERAWEWRRIHPVVPQDADADEVYDLVNGNDSAERLGVPDGAMRAQLLRAASQFSATDYIWFDPKKEPPPADIPETCSRCGLQNERGTVVCERCRTPLTMRSRYAIYQDALIGTYGGDHTGITLGAHYSDVLQWAPRMRPYPPRTPSNSADYYGGVYAATHLIYTYNDYSRFALSRDCFPEEFEYLGANLRRAIADKDPETMGEYLDSLRSFGLMLRNPTIQTGFDYLLSVQNADGSWGDVKDPDPYGRYHPTWTAIDGLREYRWTRMLPCPVYRR
jgi:hypothetical protein